MNIIQRLKNLWRLSEIEYAPYTSKTFTYEEAKQVTATGEAKIISTTSSADDLLKTIREENTREA